MVYNTSMIAKWIRWQGLIPFVIITVCIAAFWLLMADSLIKMGIEKAGTSALGAKVELKGADLSLSPLGLTLTGLEITNPDEPMTNAFEAGRLAFLMDGGRLLLGKVLIDEMSAEGIRFDTKRRYSGAIRKEQKDSKKKSTPAAADKSSGTGAAGFEIPDVDEILKREELDTLKLADKVSSEIKEKEAHWNARLKTLPDSGTLKEFERRYKEIEKKFKGSTVDKLKAANDAKQLQKDIKTASDSVKSASSDLEKDYKNLRADINSALKAPERDLSRLKEKYRLSSKGAGNLSSLIFGPKVDEYLGKARSIYSLAEPLMKKSDEKPKKPERGKGVNVKFREFHPAPAFWARKVKTEVLLEPGPVVGVISDISSDQAVTGKPTTFKLAAEGLEKTRSMEIKGAIDHRDPKAPKDNFALNVKDRTIEGMRLSSSSDLPITIRSGKSDTVVEAQVGAGGAFRSSATVKVHSAEIESSPSGSSIAKAMGKAVSALDGFSVGVKAVGTLSDYNVSVSSDIDNALKSAVGSLLKEESDRFEARLKDSIREKTEARLAGLKDDLKGIEDKKSLLAGKSGSLDSLLGKSSGIKADKLLRF